MFFASCCLMSSTSQTFLLHDLLEKADMRLGSKSAVLLYWMSQPHGVNSYYCHILSFLWLPWNLNSRCIKFYTKYLCAWQTHRHITCITLLVFAHCGSWYLILFHWVLVLYNTSPSNELSDMQTWIWLNIHNLHRMVSFISPCILPSSSSNNLQSMFCLSICHCSSQDNFWSKESALLANIPLV